MFAEPEIQKLVQFLFQAYPLDQRKLLSPFNHDNVDFFSKVVTYYSLRPRDVEQCYQLLRDFHSVWQINTRIHLGYLLPLICAYQQRKSDAFDQLAKLTSTSYENRQYLANEPGVSIDFEYASEDDPFQMKRASIYIHQIIDSYLDVLRTPARELARESNEMSAMPRWILDSMSDDPGFLGFGRSTGPKSRNVSFMRDYPDIIRNAGKLMGRPEK